MTRDKYSFTVPDSKQFIENATDLFLSTERFMLLNGNGYPGSDFDFILALGCREIFPVNSDKPFGSLNNFYSSRKDYLFGFFSYELKNRIEKLQSKNPDFVQFPEIGFWIPEFVVTGKADQCVLEYFPESFYHSSPREFIEKLIYHKKKPVEVKSEKPIIIKRIEKEQYIEKVQKFLQQIHAGNIYEANFCAEFYIENIDICPKDIYFKLNAESPMPFSALMKFDGKYLISASPERFIKKSGNRISSMPMKGTMPRGKTPEEDLRNAENLRHGVKEQSENVMIVDLVRNDLSRTAKSGTVEVEELFGVYAFPRVYQMVSTVVCEADEGVDWTEIIKNSFPPGSMTGAPKISAMKIIDQIEETARGLYSGAAGFVTPEGDFDFNVVIRSILYNSAGKYLSFITGGAITALSDPEAEYDEHLVKAEAIISVLEQI